MDNHKFDLLSRGRFAGAVLATAVLLLVLSFPQAGGAVTARHDHTIKIDEGEVIDETLFLAGESIFMDGVVDGDLFIFAQSARVRGEVTGSVYIFAQNLDVSGKIHGSYHAFAQWSTMDGTVMRNFYTFAQNLQLQENAVIARDAFFLSDKAMIEGSIERDVSGVASSLELLGKIGRDLSIESESVTLQSGSALGGDLSATVPRPEKVRVDEGATVGGEVSTDVPQKKNKAEKRSKYADHSWYLWKAGCMLAAFITGLILMVLVPGLFRMPVLSDGKLGVAFGLGLLVLVGEPIIILIVGLTIIGIPLSMVLLLLYLVAWYLAKILTAAWLGQKMLAARAAVPRTFPLALLAGLALVYVVISLPYIGWICHLVALGFGLGILVLRLQEARGGRTMGLSRSAT